MERLWDLWDGRLRCAENMEQLVTIDSIACCFVPSFAVAIFQHAVAHETVKRNERCYRERKKEKQEEEND